MSGDDVERLLGEAFDVSARARVPGTMPPPPPRFADAPTSTHRAASGRRRAWLAPVAAAAAVIAVVATVLGLQSSGHDRKQSAARPPAVASGTHTASGTHAASPNIAAVPAARAVHVKLVNTSGATYGVGMPVIALLSHRITDGRAFQRATRVTVNGKIANAAWYFEQSTDEPGYPLAAHLRLRDYWPAYAHVQVAMPIHGTSAGGGYEFADDVQLSFGTGAAMISTVNARSHRMTVQRDGRTIDTFPVSLGIKRTPTSQGTKIVMSKGRSICLSGPGFHECNIKDTQQLTSDGEYLVSAPWNISNIHRGIDTSDGCTNLMPSDAQKLYAQAEVGDVVRFPDADGPKMTAGDGYGDWNVPWSTWRRGGIVPTR